MQLYNQKIINDKGNGLESKSLYALWAISVVADNVIKKMAYISEKYGRKTRAKFDYVADTLEELFELGNNSDENTSLLLEKRAVLIDIDTNVRNAAQMIKNDKTLYRSTDYHNELLMFFNHLIELTVDDYKVLTERTKAIKADSGSFKHFIRIKIEQDGLEWVFSIQKETNGMSNYTLFINGTIYKTLESLDDELVSITNILSQITTVIANKRMQNFYIKLFLKDKGVSDLAKNIADILGGEYTNYILIAKYFKVNIDEFVSFYGATVSEAIEQIYSKDIHLSDKDIEKLSELIEL